MSYRYHGGGSGEKRLRHNRRYKRRDRFEIERERHKARLYKEGGRWVFGMLKSVPVLGNVLQAGEDVVETVALGRAASDVLVDNLPEKRELGAGKRTQRRFEGTTVHFKRGRSSEDSYRKRRVQAKLTRFFHSDQIADMDVDAVVELLAEGYEMGRSSGAILGRRAGSRPQHILG
jgi:hypothetical protein